MQPLNLPDHIYKADALTVGELRRKISNMRSDARVYIVVDKFSDYAYDDDNGQWRYAIPVVYVSRERHYGDEYEPDELNLILEIENP